MALIAMAVYSTEENQKDDCLLRTLQSLKQTIDTRKHRLILSVNAYTDATLEIINDFEEKGVDGYELISEVIYNDSNIGTAEAINKVFKLRKPNENCIKMDDDVLIYSENWIEEMEEAIRRDLSIGIIGLKRKDCIEKVNHEDPYFRSTLIQLPQVPGETWQIVEEAHHIMGTCQMYNHLLLDKIGYLYQPKQYGWDDVLASARSRAEGFKNVFLPHINIDHIDEGKTPYQQWKEKHAGEDFQTIDRLMKGYEDKSISTYYNPFQ